MYLLAIDTATNSGGVALSRNAEVVGVWIAKTPLRYAERIVPWIDRMLEEHSLRLRDIDCFAATTGPGSFTGIRIGLATVKAMAQALEKPVVGVNTLEALAYRFSWSADRVAPMIDARRQQIFGALYRRQRSEIVEESPPQVFPPAEWLHRLPEEPCLFVGDGAEFYRTTIQAIRPDDRIHPCDNTVLPSLCRLSYRRYSCGETTSARQLRALYVRPSDAEVQSRPASGRD